GVRVVFEGSRNVSVIHRLVIGLIVGVLVVTPTTSLAIASAQVSASAKRRKHGDTERTNARSRYADIALIDAADLCEVLSISPWTLAEWIKRGLIPPPFTMTPNSPRKWRVADIGAVIAKRKRARGKRELRGAVKARVDKTKSAPGEKDGAP